MTETHRATRDLMSWPRGMHDDVTIRNVQPSKVGKSI